MNIHERLGGNNARRLSPRAREFYIDGVTYPSSASDIQSTGIVLYTGEFTKVFLCFLNKFTSISSKHFCCEAARVYMSLNTFIKDYHIKLLSFRILVGLPLG